MDQVAQTRGPLAYVGPGVRPPVGTRVDSTTAQEVVLDEPGQGVVTEPLPIDEPTPCIRADDDAGDPEAVAHTVHGGRRHVVVEAAPVVPGQEDRGRAPVPRVHDRVDQPGHVGLSGVDARVRVL